MNPALLWFRRYEIEGAKMQDATRFVRVESRMGGPKPLALSLETGSGALSDLKAQGSTLNASHLPPLKR